MTLPATYKAAICKIPHAGWEIAEMPMREPHPSEVLIKVHASGICQSDHFTQDGIGGGVSFPRVAGHEVIGRVVSLGEGTQYAFQVGALVGVGWNAGYCQVHCDPCRSGDFAGCATQQMTGYTIDGGHAEYLYAPVTSVISVAEDLLNRWSYAELAPLMCAGATVYDAIKTSKFKPGDICLVQGIGGLGHLAIQYASRLGLKVYAVSSGPSKEALAKSLGAFEYIDSSATSVVDVMQSLGGANLIISTPSAIAPITAIIPAVARNGTVTVVSSAADNRIEIDNILMSIKRATVRWWTCGAAPDTAECLRFSTLTGVKSMVRTWKLEDFAEAYEDVMHGAPRFRNVIVF